MIVFWALRYGHILDIFVSANFNICRKCFSASLYALWQGSLSRVLIESSDGGTEQEADTSLWRLPHYTR